MRRIVVSIILLLYTGLYAVGLPITLHYCGGTFTGIIVNDEENCCGDEATDKDDDCCDIQHTYVKGENSHQTGPSVQTPLQSFIWIAGNTMSPYLGANGHTSSQSFYVIRKESPPLLGAHILLCNLRI